MIYSIFIILFLIIIISGLVLSIKTISRPEIYNSITGAAKLDAQMIKARAEYFRGNLK